MTRTMNNKNPQKMLNAIQNARKWVAQEVEVRGEKTEYIYLYKKFLSGSPGACIMHAKGRRTCRLFYSANRKLILK